MHIVLVDPSRTVRRALSLQMRQGGHDVSDFSDALEALSHVTRNLDIRALITSTQPLGMSGIDLCAAARKLGGPRRALHVILMSSTQDYYLAVEALDNGADDFIHKPPNPDELRARLRLADRVTAMKQDLIRYATTDPLTGLLNRRAFFEAVSAKRQEDQERPFCVIIFDIDHFKGVNDTFGHAMGDRVLSGIGARVKLFDAISGRLGGEEFCLVVSGGIKAGLDVARDLQKSIRTLEFAHDGGVVSVTCSFGVAAWEDRQDVTQIIRRADLAMYDAKKAGRDTILLSDRHIEIGASQPISIALRN